MIGTVLEKSFSQGGKQKAKIATAEGQKWYFMPEGCDVDSMLNKRVDFEAGKFSISDKKTGNQIWLHTVEKWAFVPQSSTAPVAASEVAPSVVQRVEEISAPRVAQHALSTLFDHELRFISNLVGQAIVSGACKTPSEIKAWFDAAKGALTGSVEDQIEAAISPSDRSSQTRAANSQAERILKAVKEGKDQTALEVWDECSHLKTSEAFESSVWVILPTTVQNHLKDLVEVRSIGF
jgi:hypothetical protein